MISVDGYSGCKISIILDSKDHRHILEKSAKDASYAPRLIKQMAKQRDFTRFNTIPNVTAPEVRYERLTTQSTVGSSSSSDALAPPTIVDAVYGMDFVQSLDAMTFLELASRAELEAFGRLLGDIVAQAAEDSPIATVPAKTFVDKLLDVQRNVAANPAVPEALRKEACEVVIPVLVAFVEDVARTSGCGGLRMPVGRCHGDLTLSNILVARCAALPTGNGSAAWPLGAEAAPAPSSSPYGVPVSPGLPTVPALQLVLIDFLDAFVESPLADLAKLWQDLRYGWTLKLTRQLALEKGRPLEGDAIKQFSIFQYIIDSHLLPRFGKEKWFESFFPLMFIMNQLRVLQYAHEAETATYLFDTVRTEFKAWRLGSASASAAQ